ncbi:MAG: chromosomal replication initiator DnaA [Paracoccaceae bacterium]
MAEQLILSLPVKPALGRDDFFVSDANALAVRAVENWQDWPLNKMVLVGPEGAGKTHLSYVWAGLSQAQVISATALDAERVSALAAGCVVVEDLDRIAGDAERETALFHLHNLVLAEGHSLLVTSRVPPSRMAFALKDLASRMQGAPVVTLEALDDALLTAILVKLFTDRQIHVKARVLDYVVPRISRSYAAAQAFVAEMDARALREKKPMGRGLARAVLTDQLDTEA